MTTHTTHPLFNNNSLEATLYTQLRNAGETINKIPKDQFRISSEDEIVAHVLPQMYIEFIERYDEQAIMNIEETKVDPREYSERYILDWIETIYA